MSTLRAELESGVLSRVAEDEPLFVLRAKDVLAIPTIWKWIERAERLKVPEAKLQEARDLVSAMHEWQLQNGHKDPD